MILVTVGTTAFDPLIAAIDDMKLPKSTIIQKADGYYLPRNYSYFDFDNEIEDYYHKADLVITHGGAGTLFKLLGMGKKIIGVPNLARSDHHQTDLLAKLALDGHILYCQNLNELEETINKAKSFRPKKYHPPKCDIAKIILENL